MLSWLYMQTIFACYCWMFFSLLFVLYVLTCVCWTITLRTKATSSHQQQRSERPNGSQHWKRCLEIQPLSRLGFKFVVWFVKICSIPCEEILAYLSMYIEPQAAGTCESQAAAPHPVDAVLEQFASAQTAETTRNKLKIFLEETMKIHGKKLECAPVPVPCWKNESCWLLFKQLPLTCSFTIILLANIQGPQHVVGIKQRCSALNRPSAFVFNRDRAARRHAMHWGLGDMCIELHFQWQSALQRTYWLERVNEDWEARALCEERFHKTEPSCTNYIMIFLYCFWF